MHSLVESTPLIMQNDMKQFLTAIAITLAIALTACKRDEMFGNSLPDNAIGFGTTIIPEAIFTKTNTQRAETLFADGTQCAAPGELFLVRTDAPITTTPITRAGGSYVTGGTTLPNGQRLGVYTYLHSNTWETDSATATPNFMCNQDVLVSDTDSEGQAFTYDPTRYWPTSDKLSFIAYYPYNGAGIVMKDKNGNNYTESSTGTPKAQFTVPSNIAEQIDLMYATPLTSKTADDGLLTFNFQHALTRVTFSAKLKSGNVPIQIRSITISGVKNKGTLDITDGTWENTGNATSGAGEYTFTSDSIISIIGSTTATDFRVFSTETQLLLPQTFEAGSTAKISITYNYGSGEETKEFDLVGTTAWNASTSINYTISLSKEEEEGADIIYRDGIYEIYTAKGFKAFADLVNGAGSNTSDAVCVGYGYFDFVSTHPAIDGKLMNNINLNTICGDGTDGTPAANWIPIGKFGSDYSGIFEGNDKTVSNLYIDVAQGSQKDGQGLFKKLSGGSIGNLKVTGIISSGHNSAGIVSSVIKGGTLKNCTFSGDVTTTGTRTGGVVGYLNNSTMENCINEGGNITTSDAQTGGVAGCVDNNSIVKYCTNNATIQTENAITTVTDIIVGGVVGMISNNSTMETCANTGNVSGNKDMVGGVVGYVKSSKVTACYSTGSVNGKDQIGGVAGANNYNGTITACYSTGAVKGSNHIGGVVGDNNLGSTTTACYSTGSVTGSATGNNAAIGGIIGYNGNGEGTYGKATVKYCASVSDEGTNGVGSNTGTKTNCVQKSTNIRTSKGINHQDSGTVTIGTTNYSLRPDGNNSIWGDGNIIGGSANNKKAPKLFWE